MQSKQPIRHDRHGPGDTVVGNEMRDSVLGADFEALQMVISEVVRAKGNVLQLSLRYLTDLPRAKCFLLI